MLHLLVQTDDKHKLIFSTISIKGIKLTSTDKSVKHSIETGPSNHHYIFAEIVKSKLQIPRKYFANKHT